ncbi:MAG: DinB family protein [Planctomycetota bacterium]|jgi:hypothetical protein
MAKIRTLLPPGGFSNLVGHHVAALDLGLEAMKAAARTLPEEGLRASPVNGLPSVVESLRAAGEREGAWIHQALGGVPTPPPPVGEAGHDAWCAWLDAVRTVTIMVLRPLPDRDLERLVELPGVEGRTTLRRVLAELLEHQACRRADVETAARLLS